MPISAWRIPVRCDEGEHAHRLTVGIAGNPCSRQFRPRATAFESNHAPSSDAVRRTGPF